MFYRINDIYRLSGLSLFEFILVFIKFRFTLIMTNYDTHKGLSNVIIDLINSGIKNIKTNEYNMVIDTNKGEINGWDANKYYAWFSQGHLKIFNGLETDWEDTMPTFSVLLLLYVLITYSNNNIYEQMCDSINNCNDF